MRASTPGILLALLLVLTGPVQGTEPAAGIAEPHARLLTLDSHLDTPIRLSLGGFDITRRHDATHDYCQVDLPRMQAGGLDGGFWVVFTPQGELTASGYAQAWESATRRLGVIERMVAEHPAAFALATRADDAARIVASGRHVVYLSIENAYPLGEDLSRLQHFYDHGVRMLGIVHSSNNQFADSSTDAAGPRWNGLSPLGEALVREANRLGMIIDASHAHDLALEQMLALSTTPVILSHSGAKDVFDHPRNVDDRLLRKIAADGGVIQMNSLGAYLTAFPENAARQAALGTFVKALRAADASGEPMPLETFGASLRAIDAEFGRSSATFEDYMAHFEHVLSVAGPHATGVGADWDGGGGVTGMHDVSMIPAITAHLVDAGYDEADLARIWSGNLLRVLSAVEQAAEGG